MHNHCRVEKLPQEILEAFKASDRQHNGTIDSKHLKHLLQGWGEHLSRKEGKLIKKNQDPELNCNSVIDILVEQIFREANVHPNGKVNYDEFVKIACAPIPDYY